ncbi:MAG: membrane protein insertion efficiency factor YidD [Verrucomicrobia bacterium]|nr:membrane protein insertion efficiency factor YidD [Verrucomicrobiota bacterium]
MRKLITMLIRIYQVTVSPLLGPCCRFHPSCSRYCIEAVEKHGAFRGLWLGLRRICRCHPFNPGGVDPVPEPDMRKRTVGAETLSGELG